MQYSETLISRYEKIAALAERGAQGEKTNAIHHKAKLESKYPGIGYQAGMRAKRQAEASRAGPGPYDASNGAFGGAQSSEERWAKWSQMAGAAFSWASDVAGEVAGTEYARQCAKHYVIVTSKNLPSAKFQTSAKLPLKELYSLANGLSLAQKQVFAQTVGALVAEQMFNALQDD